MPSAKPTEFDAYRNDYRERVESSIAFSGAELDFFTQAKVRELLDLTSRRLGDTAALDFLDVCCGQGETDRFLAGRVASLTRIDIASKLVERAVERNPWAQYRTYRIGEPIPAADDSFDVSFAICVFHHVEADDRPALLAEMKRVTRRDGIVAVFEHNPWNPPDQAPWPNASLTGMLYF